MAVNWWRMEAPCDAVATITAAWLVPGCEFELPGEVAHVGRGSHGALHALDSFSPVVIGGAGAPKLPRTMRAVDIAPLCVRLLGLPTRYAVGDPRESPVGVPA